jgi:hypothetical protein
MRERIQNCKARFQLDAYTVPMPTARVPPIRVFEKSFVLAEAATIRARDEVCIVCS